MTVYGKNQRSKFSINGMMKTKCVPFRTGANMINPIFQEDAYPSSDDDDRDNVGDKEADEEEGPGGEEEEAIQEEEEGSNEVNDPF